MWELRHNIGAYDAAYIALAEALGCELLTGDVKLKNAAGAAFPPRPWDTAEPQPSRHQGQLPPPREQNNQTVQVLCVSPCP
jgi:hypothetical protein